MEIKTESNTATNTTKNKNQQQHIKVQNHKKNKQQT